MAHQVMAAIEFLRVDVALRMAYRECGITMTAMAAELGFSALRISRLIAAAELSGREWRQKARPDPHDPVTLMTLS